VDFVPSILDLMGVAYKRADFHGISFSSELTNKMEMTDRGRTRYTFDSGENAYWVCAIMQQYKLIISRVDTPWLFDLDVDPYERVNYFDDPNYAQVRDDLLDSLFLAMDEYNIPLKDASRVIDFSTPACLDSNNQFLMNSKPMTCAEFSEKTIVNVKCEKTRFQHYCPVTCGACCQDSLGKIWFNGSLKDCSQL